MADRMLVISWGETVRGREERALEVFNEALGIYGRLEQQGRLESYDVKLLAPNAMVAGYVELKGSAAQLAAVKDDPEFMRLCADAGLVVDRFTVTDGYCDEGVAEQVALFQEAVGEVPQTV